jgi:hypothetical protein
VTAAGVAAALQRLGGMECAVVWWMVAPVVLANNGKRSEVDQLDPALCLTGHCECLVQSGFLESLWSINSARCPLLTHCDTIDACLPLHFVRLQDGKTPKLVLD